jgi:hypothetical protein
MDPLAQAILGAGSSGGVRMVKGKVGTNGSTIRVSGGRITKYRRVGTAPAAGDSVVVLMSGASTPVVLTGVQVVV